jgi:hypothetical protein
MSDMSPTAVQRKAKARAFLPVDVLMKEGLLVMFALIRFTQAS